MDLDKTKLDQYLTKVPSDPREPFYERVMNHIPTSKLSEEGYEKHEHWFIILVDKLYDLCPTADTELVSKFVIECWDYKKICDLEDCA